MRSYVLQGNPIMRILHLRSSRGIFGAEKVILGLSRGLTASRFVAEVVVFEDSREPHVELVEAARDAGLAAASIPCRGRFDPGFSLRLGRLIQEGGFDILHCHDYKGIIYGLPAAALAGVPAVATLHGDTSHTLAVTLYERAARAALSRFRRVVVVSDAQAEALKKRLPAGRLVRVPNGIDVAPFAGRRSPGSEAKDLRNEFKIGGAPVVVSVGRLSREKGHVYLLRAVARLRRSERPAVLLVGDGPMRGKLEILARILRVRLILAGYRHDVERVLESADVFVLPSITEGLPISVLEAMAAKVPVVATRVGDLPEVLEGGAGYLVPPKDVRAMAQAIRGALSATPEETRRITDAAAIRVADRYSIDAMARCYVEDVYSPVLKEAGAVQASWLGGD